jgi:5,10-methylenetetrahydromethanopterin reductase
VASELADGLITLGGQTGAARDFDWTAIAVHGTVLADGEPLQSPRVRSAAGPGHALAYHTTHEFGGDVTALPGGQVWLDEIEKTPPADRHFAIYDQHLIGLNHADAVAWDAGSWAAVPQTTITGSPTEVAERLVQYHRDGVDDIVYQPAGEDIIGELTSFMAAARIAIDRTQPDRIRS